jgi:hypothetical protein
MEQKKPYRYYFILLLVAVNAMLPVVLMQHPLKYDMIDQAYPWRYFIGQCLQNGILPFWNPYQLLGSAIHADPQSSAWYPFTWAIGYLFGYNIYTISLDFCLHIFLAGMGIFYLARQLRFRIETAFFMAVSYMLSGFFIGNAQHFMWVISGTWIPFIIGAFLALKEKPSPAAAIRFALASFMILTGGYPAFVFLLAYLLTGIYILFAVEMLRKKERRELYRFTGFSALAVLFTALMAMVVLVSVYHLQGAMTRSGGVTLKQALFCAFTPKSFISFILPFASIRNMDFFNTDLSMSNAYFGLITLVFFLFALTIKKTKLINLFLAWGIFCLIAATGGATPLREFLYRFVPGMDQFRFPALFRIYAILSFIIVAGYGFEKLKIEDLSLKRKLLIAVGVVALSLFGFMIYSITRKDLNFSDFLKHDLFIFSEKSRISQHILFQGAIQLLLLGSFFFILKKKEMRCGLAAILLIVSVDMIVATRLNGPYTLYSHIYKSKEVYAHAKEYPDGFPLPGNERIIDNKDQGALVFQTLWRNLNIFQKQVSYQGYNPLHLKGFEEMADNHTRTYETILENPLVYLSGTISPLDSLASYGQKGSFDPRRVYLEEKDFLKLSGQGLHPSEGDNVRITAFSPVQVTVKSASQGNVLVNLLQNNYYGWKATIDGQPAAVITANMSFIAAEVPPGEHEVVFSYDPTGVRWGFYITLMALVVGLVYLKEYRR